MNARLLVAATVFAAGAGALLSIIGIQDRFEGARQRGARSIHGGEGARLHEGPPPCRRYVDAEAIPAAETASAARALAAGGFTPWMPEVLLVTWAWTDAAERAAHAQDADAEQVSAVMRLLSPADRFWLRTLGKNRLVELTGTSTETHAQLTAHAAEAEARLPGPLRESLRALWEKHPRVLVVPADVGLVRAVAAIRPTP